MTLLAKARENRLAALARRAEMRTRERFLTVPMFRSRRGAANLDAAPAARRLTANG